jgi:hypothetical protein
MLKVKGWKGKKATIQEGRLKEKYHQEESE